MSAPRRRVISAATASADSAKAEADSIRQQYSAQKVAAWLEQQSAVRRVVYPGLDSFPQRELVIDLTFGVVLLSILLQGLTVAPLVRRIGRDTGHPAWESIAEASFGRLKKGILAFISETHFKRITMILRSAGFVISDMIGGQNAVNFAYTLSLRGRADGVPAADLERLVRRWYARSVLRSRYSGSPARLRPSANRARSSGR